MYDKHTHLDMMQHPGKWPQPVLPLIRRRNGEMHCGLLQVCGMGQFVVVRGNLFGPDFPTEGEDQGKVTVYETAEAVYVDGWEVD